MQIIIITMCTLICIMTVGYAAFATQLTINGTAGSSIYAETHKNTNSSTIKKIVDTWYQNNLTNYSSLIEDAGFCGDRSVAPSADTWASGDTALGYGTNATYYGAESRLDPDVGISEAKPQFKCPQSNDLYTTSSSTKGNKALTYPIGLITADEVAYAGGTFFEENSNYYLYAQNTFLTMSPAFFDSAAAIWGVSEDGGIYYEDLSFQFDMRPFINLKSTVEITSGDGTVKKPYFIKTN